MIWHECDHLAGILIWKKGLLHLNRSAARQKDSEKEKGFGSQKQRAEAFVAVYRLLQVYME